MHLTAQSLYTIHLNSLDALNVAAAARAASQDGELDWGDYPALAQLLTMIENIGGEDATCGIYDDFPTGAGDQIHGPGEDPDFTEERA